MKKILQKVVIALCATVFVGTIVVEKDFGPLSVVVSIVCIGILAAFAVSNPYKG